MSRHGWLHQLELKPGFQLRRTSANTFQVFGTEGPVRMADGRVLLVGGADSCPTTLKMIRKDLAAAGVLAEHRPPERNGRPKRREHTSSSKSPLLQAEAVLADARASYRERGLAKFVIDQQRSLQNAVELARRLSARVKELEARLER